MTQHRPIPLDLAFVPADTPTFSELITQLQSEPNLRATRKRDLISGLNRVAKALGLPPTDIPCDSRWLQPRLSRVSPPMIGLNPKSWQNAVSDARAAMAVFGIVQRRSNRTDYLDAHWRPLWEQMIASGDRTLPTALRRFVHFLNRMGICPDDVCDDHAAAYREALITNEISKDPETVFRAAINGWSLAGRRIQGWPPQPLSLPSRQIRVALEETEFPSSFLSDLDLVFNRLGQPDPSDDTAPPRPRSPATIKQYRYQTLRFASHLVDSGVTANTITSLATLLEPELAKQGLRQMLARNDGQTSRDISQTAALLRNLSRILALPDSQRKALADLAKKVARPTQTGMTARNRARLRVLQDPRHKRRLLSLPEHIFKTHNKPARLAWNALAREDALAIAILLVCPVRVGSFARIKLDTHIQRPGDGRVFLVLEAQDTKTGRSIEFELPTYVVALLDKHLATRCPHRCPAGTQFLFPQSSGARSVAASVLGGRISKRIRKETGLEVNAHLFRHFAVMNWLDANPGGYEVARRLLGHSALSHTINMYSGMEVTSATKAFSDLIADMRGKV